MDYIERIQKELTSVRFEEAKEGDLIKKITEVFLAAAGQAYLTGTPVNVVGYIMGAAHIGMIAEREGWCLDEFVEPK